MAARSRPRWPWAAKLPKSDPKPIRSLFDPNLIYMAKSVKTKCQDKVSRVLNDDRRFGSQGPTEKSTMSFPQAYKAQTTKRSPLVQQKEVHGGIQHAKGSLSSLWARSKQNAAKATPEEKELRAGPDVKADAIGDLTSKVEKLTVDGAPRWYRVRCTCAACVMVRKELTT